MMSSIIVLGFPEDSLDSLESGIDAARDLDDRKSLIRFYSNTGLYHSSKGRHEQGIEFVEKAYAEAHSSGDLTSIAQTTPDLVLMKMSEGRFSEVIDIAAQLIKAIRKEGRELDTFGGPAVVMPAHLSMSGYAMSHLGRFEEAHHKFEESLEVASRADNVFTMAICNGYTARSLALQGKWREAREFHLTTLSYLEKATFPTLEALAKSGLGIAEAFLGDPQYGEKLVKEARACLKAADAGWNRSFIFFSQSICSHEAGAVKKAHALVDKALRLAVKENQVDIIGHSLLWKGRIARQLSSPPPEEAESSILKGLKIFTDLKIKPDAAMGRLFLGEHYAALSEPAQALIHLRKAEESFVSMDMDYWLQEARKLIERLGSG